MEHTTDQLNTFREHQKTQFLMTQYDDTKNRLEEARELAASDPEMAVLAEDEISALAKQLDEQYLEMARIIESSKEEEAKPYGVVLEVRAGAGGDEAALFAEELANAYLKYAEIKGWQTSRNHVSVAGSGGGYKEAAFEITSPDVYGLFRYETGSTSCATDTSNRKARENPHFDRISSGTANA